MILRQPYQAIEFFPLIFLLFMTNMIKFIVIALVESDAAKTRSKPRGELWREFFV